MIAKVILLISMVVLQVGCAAAQSYPAENGFKFFDPDTQRLFVESLERAGVAHRVREDGTVLYSPRDEAKVSEIRLSVLQASFVPSAYFADERLEARFIERLNAEHIPHGIQVKGGQRWITWSERDDKRVESIRRSVLDSR